MGRDRRKRRRRVMMVKNAMNKHEDEKGHEDPQEEQGAGDGASVFSDDDAEQLEKLAELKDKGIITEEEFNMKKKQILGI